MTRRGTAEAHGHSASARPHGRSRRVLLGAGPHVALDFIRAWRAWLDDPDRFDALWYVALGWTEPSTEFGPDAPDNPRLRPLVRRLCDALPPPTANLHRIAFEGGHVQLLLTAEIPERALRDLTADVDAFHLDLDVAVDVDAPSAAAAAVAAVAEAAHMGVSVDVRASVDVDLDTAGNPAPAVLLDRAPCVAASLARLAAPGATLRSAPVSDAGRRALGSAGFDVAASASASEDPSRPRLGAVFRPRAAPRRDARRAAASEDPGAPVVIVGAGLAGCAAAWALAEQGRRSIVVDRHAAIADEASGNPAGLFHGIVNGQDGTHARLHRAAALEAAVAARDAIERHGARGAVDGLLQFAGAGETITAMQDRVARLGLPEGFVRPLDAEAAAAVSGLAPSRPGWFFPGGGWIAPRDLASAFLARAGAQVEVRHRVEVAAIRRQAADWHLLDPSGSTILSGAVVVLANAGDALRLAGGGFPVEPVRGQLSRLPLDCVVSPRLPRVPVSGAGYLLPAHDGHVVFGATAQRGDADPRIRPEDHRSNLERLARLAPDCGIGLDALRHLSGRAGIRWTARDRLPLIGAVPRFAAGAPGDEADRSCRLDQPRFVARERGLFLFAALGSRGLTWAALGAQILASSITGAPAPVESSLLDAVDPARFAARVRRRAAR